MFRQHLETIRKLLFSAYLFFVAGFYQLSWMYAHSSDAGGIPADRMLVAAIVIWGLVLWNHKNLYLFRSRTNFEVLRTGIAAVFKASAAFVIFSYFFGDAFDDRLQIGLFLSLSSGWVCVLQVAINTVLRHYRSRGYNYQTILIVGTSDRARRFADSIFGNPEWGFRITGFVDPENTKDGDGKRKLWSYREVPLLGALHDIDEIIKSRQVDWVVFAVENERLKEIEEAVVLCQEMGTRAVVLADLYPSLYAQVRAEEFFELPALLFDSVRPRQGELVVKELFDRMVAALALALALPVLAASAVAIKIFSRGPILFKQKRLGLNGRKFTMYKFRTMVPQAEKLKEGLARYNEMDGPVFKIGDDPRITRIGRFLRRTSLDELPQIINVLKGDMSLVGPRPPLANEVEQYDPWQRRRLAFKPGITCLWQISGRNNVNFEKWMKLDLEYIDNWSLWLDAKILAKTIPAVLTGRGAK